MKIRKLLEIQSKFEEAVIPRDMNNIDLNKHYSESEDKEIDILDMDLIHLIRSYSKCIRKNNLINKLDASEREDLEVVQNTLREKLDTILKETYDAREIIDTNEK